MWKRLVVAILMFSPKLGFGADLSTADLNGVGCEFVSDEKICLTVLLRGEIIPGDSERLERYFDQLNGLVETQLKLKVRIGKLHFDSPGGDLVESIKIGHLIRRNLLSTQVTYDSSCSSACVIAYLGGVFRVPVGPMGIHSFYSREFIGPGDYEKASENYNAMASKLEAYLKEMRVPARFLDEMKMVPPNTLKILDFAEIEALGVIGIDPVYAQIRQNKQTKSSPNPK